MGSRMWNLLTEDGDVARVVGRMRAEYDVDEATLRQDLALLIAKLSDAGLLTLEPSTPGSAVEPSTPASASPS